MNFFEMTAAGLAETDREQTLVVIPIAAVEQHGPHMPTGTDFILCSAVTEALEARMPDKVLLTPAIWLGASSHHLRLGSTLDSNLETFVGTLCDVAHSLLQDGYLRILFVNGHGGNVDPLRMALRILQPQHPSAVLAGGSYWSVAEEFIQETLDGEHKFVGHACEFETSMVLHVRPDLVQTELLKNAGKLIADNMNGVFLSRDMCQRTREGYTGRPDLASAGKGQVLFDGIVDRLVMLVRKLLAEPLGTEYSQFAE